MKVKFGKVVRKYWEYAVTKIKILYAQKVFLFEGVKVKYMLKKHKESDILLIVFSACTRRGLKARYNYVKTLDGLGCNRVYILDDYSEDQRGSYYLGHDFLFDEERATNALIDKIISEIKPQKVVFCGSSKGGYAALNFGLQRVGAYIVAGAPQFFLARYLKASGNMSAYNHIMGDYSDEKELYIDAYLRDRIMRDEFADTQCIYLHYSDKEHTYGEHVMHLLDAIRSKSIKCICDVADYANHSDISYFFPDYLRECIMKIKEV